MRSLIHFISELFTSENINNLNHFIIYLPFYASVIFTLYIAFYVSKHYTGVSKNIITGAIIQAVSVIINLIIIYLIFPNYEGNTIIFLLLSTLNQLFGGIGTLLFLYGIFMLLKELFQNKKNQLVSNKIFDSEKISPLIFKK